MLRVPLAEAMPRLARLLGFRRPTWATREIVPGTLMKKMDLRVESFKNGAGDRFNKIAKSASSCFMGQGLLARRPARCYTFAVWTLVFLLPVWHCWRILTKLLGSHRRSSSLHVLCLTRSRGEGHIENGR